MKKQKVIAIVGPTASGKSSLGVYIAQKIDGEIISADSRQVYKGLDIGTGKVTKKEMAGVPHHLLDIASPKRRLSAEDFVRKAAKTLHKISQADRAAIVVGGTGFYIDALLGRLVLPDVPPNPTLRKRLAHKTPAQLLTMLKKLDPRRAKAIEPHHARRLIRAIEIAAAIGQSPLPKTETKRDVLWLGLSPTQATLHKNIHSRLESRLRSGMLAEARRLHAAGVSYKRMEELGLEYRYMARLLQKKMTRAQFEEELERAIRQYAKRQARWFKRNKDIVWVGGKAEALKLSKYFLAR